MIEDVQQDRRIKNRNINVLTSEESVLSRWKEHCEKLMNKENERERQMEDS